MYPRKRCHPDTPRPSDRDHDGQLSPPGRSGERSWSAPATVSSLVTALEEARPPEFTDPGPAEPTLDKLIDYVSRVDRAYKSGQLGSGLRYNTAYQLIPCLPALRRLQGLIGLTKIKQQVVDLVLYIATQYHCRGDYLHSLVVGPPGVGKSTLIEIIAELMTRLRVCRRGQVVRARASDLISQWVGGTAGAVVDVFKEAVGGVLVIDEAYQLGTDGRNSHAMECLNMLNQLLSEYRQQVICFLAGYQDLIEERVFRLNPGLRSRFAYTFVLTDYTNQELFQILTRTAALNNWSVDPACADLIQRYRSRFRGQGRDMDHLFRECRILIALNAWKSNQYQPLTITPSLLRQALDKLPVEKPEELSEGVRMMFN